MCLDILHCTRDVRGPWSPQERQLLLVPRLLLNKLRDAFVACGNPKHDCPRFTGFHFASHGAYFFGAEAPKFRVLKLACGHGSTVRVVATLTVPVPTESDGVYNF